ncbi:MAG: hypothetical protein IT269_14840 [Saprospiraceae bacterium]|nr:hypothetical protein [Saprospiraceae bacterium]
MKKEEIELIILTVNIGGESALYMKIYKDRTLVRSGCGGLPQIPVSAIAFNADPKYWEEAISMIDDEMIARPVNYQEENISTPIEYVMAFYGESSNGQTGEQAQWTKSSGIRFVLDFESTFRHPLLVFVDKFILNAVEMTNELYFDIMMIGVYGFRMDGFEQGFVSAPKTDEEKRAALSHYIGQIAANQARGWDIVKIGDGRKYKTNDGVDLISRVSNAPEGVSINFSVVANPENIDQLMKPILEKAREEKLKNPAPPVEPAPEEPYNPPKKWWEVWK